MNRPVRRVVIAVLVLFAALLANITYVQFVEAGSLRNNSLNGRGLIAQYAHPRGQIIADGQAIASSVATTDTLKYQRHYPEGKVFAPITGFDSLYNQTAIEGTEDGLLDGSDGRLALRRISDIFTGREPKGGNVVVTISRRAQETAYNAMAKQTGAVVALDPRTGAILAMVSTPSWDPNLLSTHDSAQTDRVYNRLDKDAHQPLLDRAIAQNYPPGSTFKTVIAAAALNNGLTPQTRVPAPDALQLPGSTHVLHNFAGETCGNGMTDTLIHALAISCNTAYAKLGMKLGAGPVKTQAAAFGITDQGFTMPLRVAASSTGPIPSQAALAESSIGQQDVRLTPMQGAMIAAAIADKGALMKPYLVNQEEAPDLTVLKTTQPQRLRTAMTPAVSASLTTMMEAVVSQGTGQPAQIPGVKVAGKTGTADNAPGKAPHAWFIGFAPADHPTVAVAVLIEHGGVRGNETTGGMAAGPVAKAVMQAVLAQQGGR
ncbi:MAG: peptidoglycan D,D-transpeptidase FtsI family protein [Mycobacteriales bacterium]